MYEITKTKILFRRKPEFFIKKRRPIPAKAGISLFTLIFRFNLPSHSCEGRNLHRRIAAGNLRLRRGDSCLRRNGTGGAGMGLGGMAAKKNIAARRKCRIMNAVFL
ncbi:MAG: hypothetical protein ACR2QC_00380 [Gammaproteobacteria bacterium]